jgi:hypothetical protein
MRASEHAVQDAAFWQDGRDSLEGNKDFVALQHQPGRLLDSIVWFPINSARFHGSQNH